jgi:hypothetical protein
MAGSDTLRSQQKEEDGTLGNVGATAGVNGGGSGGTGGEGGGDASPRQQEQPRQPAQPPKETGFASRPGRMNDIFNAAVVSVRLQCTSSAPGRWKATDEPTKKNKAYRPVSF